MGSSKPDEGPSLELDVELSPPSGTVIDKAWYVVFLNHLHMSILGAALWPTFWIPKS